MNKDDIRKLSECMFINLDEMDAMGKSSAARLKELITKPEINQRRAYGMTNERYIRNASFLASLNHYQFLRDHTGSRRFLTFKVVNIDLDVMIDMDQVYAQASKLIEGGFQTDFSAECVQKIQDRNNSFTHMTPLESAIFDNFIEGTSADRFFTASMVANEIKSACNQRMVDRSFATKVGAALSKKFSVVRKGNMRGYHLRKLGVDSFS
jgi:predicted P-loop ATPase